MLLAVLLLGLCGCGAMRDISEKAFGNATGIGAKAELDRSGHPVRGTIACTLPRDNTPSVVRVHCTGRTVRGEPIRVWGIAHGADTPDPRQEFVITVAGREVLRKPCLGLSCGKGPAG
jgi:hypothetical protein